MNVLLSKLLPNGQGLVTDLILMNVLILNLLLDGQVLVSGAMIIAGQLIH